VDCNDSKSHFGLFGGQRANVTNIINATGSHKINLKFVALAGENDAQQLTKMTASYDRTAASETRPRGRVKVRSRRARDLQHQRCSLKSCTR
jgi:hypothetical protein